MPLLNKGEFMNKSTIPISSLKKTEKMVQVIEDNERNTLSDIKEQIKKMSQKIDKTTEVNIELQNKIVQLMLKITEFMSALEKKLNGTGNINIKSITEQNKELTETLKKVENELKREELRKALRNVIKGI